MEEIAETTTQRQEVVHAVTTEEPGDSMSGEGSSEVTETRPSHAKLVQTCMGKNLTQILKILFSVSIFYPKLCEIINIACGKLLGQRKYKIP